MFALLRPVFAVALLLPLSTIAAEFSPAPLTPAQAAADIALMRRALETIHPGLYRYDSRAAIDAAFTRLERGAAGGSDQLRLWRDVALMLATVHCDHTKPEPPAALERYRIDHPTHLPLRFRLVEGRMIVIANDGQAGAPPAGSELVAINGRPVPQVLTTLGQAVAYDGDTTPAIAAKLASDNDLAGDDFNEYWPAFFGFATRWELDWKRAGAARSEHASLAPIDQGHWTALAWPGAPYRAEFYRAFEWRLTGKTAYLRMDTFVNYRNPVDPTAFLGGFFQSLRAAGADRLVLDLRASGGGSEDVAIALGRYLLADDFVWSKPALLKAIRYGDLADHIASWGNRAALFTPSEKLFERTSDGWWLRLPEPGPYEGALRQAVSPDRFRGQLTVLTGPMNASGATRTIAHLQEAGARLVGEATAGSAEGPTAGQIFLLTLPNSGIRMRIPVAWNRTNVASFTPRLGVAPTQLVTPTYLDVLDGNDAALAVATGPSTPPPVLAVALAGHWTGTLDYRDYTSDRRVSLPVQASVAADGGALDADFTIDDGPGKTVRSSAHWQLDAATGLLRIDGETMRISELRGGAGRDMTLVAEGKARENGDEVAVRTIWRRRGDRLSMTHLSQRPGQPWLLRNSYWLHSD